MGFLDNLFSGITNLFSSVSRNQLQTMEGSSVPQAFTIISDPLQTLALPQFFQSQVERNALIQDVEFLKQENQLALNFLNKDRGMGGGTPCERNPLSCRGPNSLGSLGRKGNVISINPFTGGRFVVGTTFRSSVTDFTAINRNRSILNFGNLIQSFIASNRTKIGLFSTRIDNIQTL